CVNFPVSRSSRKTRTRGGHRRHDGPRSVGIAGAKGRVYAQITQITRIGDHRSLCIGCSDARAHATPRRKSETRPHRGAVKMHSRAHAGAFSFSFSDLVTKPSRIFATFFDLSISYQK